MLDIQVLEINTLLVRKRVKNTLEERPVFIAIYPMLIYTRLYFFEFETRERVKGEIKPIFPFYYQITDEQALCCACQIQDSNYVIHL